MTIWSAIVLLVLGAGWALFQILTTRPAPIVPAAPPSVRQPANRSAPAQEMAQVPASAPVLPAQPPATQPAPAETQLAQEVIVAASHPKPDASRPAEEPPKVEPPKPSDVPRNEELAPDPKFAMMVPLEEGEQEETVTLNTPKEIQIVPALNGHKKVNLRGQALKLEIESLNGEAGLEVSHLQAHEILLAGGMNGKTQLKIDQPGAVVRVEQGINGEARVEILAPGGTVRFKDTAVIEGGCKVRIVARAVELGLLNGGARVEVSLTRGGSLSFVEIAGGAKLQWGKADPNDPQPAIQEGKVNLGTRFEQK